MEYKWNIPQIVAMVEYKWNFSVPDLRGLPDGIYVEYSMEYKWNIPEIVAWWNISGIIHKL